jgi:hypothetical protein
MTNSIDEFTLELEDEINKRTYLTSKWDMLGVRNQGEKFKTVIAILIGDIINKWYNTEFTEDNFCEEEDILIALETFNAICKSNVWYDINVVDNLEPSYSPISTFHYWNDSLYWDDFTIWED